MQPDTAWTTSIMEYRAQQLELQLDRLSNQLEKFDNKQEQLMSKLLILESQFERSLERISALEVTAVGQTAINNNIQAAHTTLAISTADRLALYGGAGLTGGAVATAVELIRNFIG